MRKKLRILRVEDFELQDGWSCCFLGRVKRWREEQVSGGRSRAQRLSLDSYTETIRLLDGDTDLLVGYTTLTQEEKTECRRCGISVVFKATRRMDSARGCAQRGETGLGSGVCQCLEEGPAKTSETERAERWKALGASVVTLEPGEEKYGDSVGAGV